MKPATVRGNDLGASPISPRQPVERSGPADLGARLLFSRNIQHVATRVHAMLTVDDILLDAGADIRRVFNAERLQIYVISDDGRLLHSKVRATDGTVSDFRRPIKTTSLVGVVALTHAEVNLSDAGDPDELATVHADLQAAGAFGIEAGETPHQVLAAPIIYRSKRAQGGELLGVAQLINSRSGQPFGATEIDGFR